MGLLLAGAPADTPRAKSAFGKLLNRRVNAA
jgi:hypothetical protein